jgi:predicted metal-binding membrane protein
MVVETVAVVVVVVVVVVVAVAVAVAVAAEANNATGSSPGRALSREQASHASW